MQKFLIIGEVYERKKRYVVFSSGEEYVFNIKKNQSSMVVEEKDKEVFLHLRQPDFVAKLISENNNFWYSIKYEDDSGDEVHISNIKCFTHPTLINYELEQYRAALYN